MALGISAAGGDAEARFRRVTGASPAGRAADGDALLDGHLVEVKAASTSTLNQVRAVKYLTIVVLDQRIDRWFVIPPHRVVRAVSTKARGQHTENPFESATLNLTAFSDCLLGEEVDLRTATLDAVEEGDRYPELREVMTDVAAQSKELATASRDRVQEVLQRLGLG